jgi:hypothetical protein
MLNDHCGGVAAKAFALNEDRPRAVCLMFLALYAGKNPQLATEAIELCGRLKTDSQLVECDAGKGCKGRFHWPQSP